MAELSEMFRAFSEGSQGTFQQNEFFRQEQNRLEKERIRANQQQVATGAAMDAVIGLDLLNKGQIDDFNELTASRVQSILFEGRNPDDTLDIAKLVNEGKIEEAKTDLRTFIRAAQLRLPGMPKDDEMIQNILGEKTTAMRKAEAEVVSEEATAAKTQAEVASVIAETQLEERQFAQAQKEFKQERQLEREKFKEETRQYNETHILEWAKLAQEKGVPKGDDELRKANITRLSNLNESAVMRHEASQKAQAFLEAFKVGRWDPKKKEFIKQESGFTRRILLWTPGVWTDLQSRDQEMEALSMEIARARLRAYRESKTTDKDVDDMRAAGPRTYHDEAVNITLLQQFLNENVGLDAERSALQSSARAGTLGFYVGTTDEALSTLPPLPEGYEDNKNGTVTSPDGIILRYNGDGTWTAPDGTIGNIQ